MSESGGSTLIQLNIKTAKDKKTIELKEDASIDDVSRWDDIIRSKQTVSNQ